MGRQNTYANPFILERADPFMIKADDGWYYFTASYPMKRGDDPEGYDRVILRRSKTVDGLREAEEITIWQADEKTHTHRHHSTLDNIRIDFHMHLIVQTLEYHQDEGTEKRQGT